MTMRSRADAETDFGDTYEDEAGAVTGSRLWLLCRQKVTDEVLQKCKDFCEQALAWLVTEGVASAVKVSVERNGLDRVDILVEVVRGKDATRLRFADVWKGFGNGI